MHSKLEDDMSRPELLDRTKQQKLGGFRQPWSTTEHPWTWVCEVNLLPIPSPKIAKSGPCLTVIPSVLRRLSLFFSGLSLIFWALYLASLNSFPLIFCRSFSSHFFARTLISLQRHASANRRLVKILSARTYVFCDLCLSFFCKRRYNFKDA